MRAPASIKSWLSVKKMFQWLQNAPDQSSYKRRMAIWLTHTGKLNAPKVADILAVSTQSIWLWVHQYNTQGPKGLQRKGRGGRRWGFMTPQQEKDFLKPLFAHGKSDSAPKPSKIKHLIEEKIGRKVSMPYIYRLLHRHRWYEKIAQSQQPSKPSSVPDNFQKFSRPWLRH